MGRFRFSRFLAPAAVLALVIGLAAAAAEIKIPPPPARWATDDAAFLSPETVRSLDADLERFERESGHQVLVYVGKTTGGYPIEEFAVKAFEAWKPGRKGLDDGLVLFIMADDRKMRIEVGYGLEDKVTDAVSSRIINDILTPGFRSGDRDAAVRAAVAAVEEAITGTAPPASAPQAEERRGRSAQSPIPVIIGIIIFLIIAITHPRFALWLLFTMLSGGRGGGGGGGGGGGFSGGGGRSGGGGASGGW